MSDLNKIYIIDPLGSLDADDAFGINQENNSMFLYIFIADPTKYFMPFDNVFNKIVKKSTTKYFFETTPNHLFDEHILNLSNLNNKNSTVSSICFKINVSNPLNDYTISQVDIKTDKIQLLNYETAELNDDLIKALKISERLFNRRKSKIKVLNDYKLTYPKYNKDIGIWELTKDTETCIKLKNMIAEFAIIVNQIVAQELSFTIFRSCDNLINTQVCGEDVILSIIKNGISAEYTSSNTPHLLIDDRLYCHFTSPLRRASDCICHFLLKEKINSITNSAFTKDYLQYISEHFTRIFKEDKKRFYKENKKYTILAMLNLPTRPIRCHFKYLSDYNSLTNLILSKVNEYNVQISISLKNFTFAKQDFYFDINHINPNGKFDNDIFPELNSLTL